MSGNKIKYMIFPDRIYTLEFLDFDDNPFKVDIEGFEIINSLRKTYALEKFINDTDCRINRGDN
jgi:hypothetical protein